MSDPTKGLTYGPRCFVAYWYRISYGILSFGISVDIRHPTIEVHLPFGFIRVGWMREARWDVSLAEMTGFSRLAQGRLRASRAGRRKLAGVRHYELERDDAGQVVRMVWLGPQPQPEPTCCQPPWQLCDACKWRAWTGAGEHNVNVKISLLQQEPPS